MNWIKRPVLVAAMSVLLLRGLTLASRFLLSVLLARTLSPDAVGEYGLITATLAFALVVLGLEFYSHTMRELVPASPARRVEIIANQLVLAAIIFAVVVLAGALAVLVGLFSPRLVAWFLLISRDGAPFERGNPHSHHHLTAGPRLYRRIPARGNRVYVIAALMLAIPGSARWKPC